MVEEHCAWRKIDQYGEFTLVSGSDMNLSLDIGG